MWLCMYEVQAISQDQGNLPLEYSLLPSITMVPLCTRVAVFSCCIMCYLKAVAPLMPRHHPLGGVPGPASAGRGRGAGTLQTWSLSKRSFDLADVLGEDVAGSGSKEDLLKKADKELEVGIVAPRMATLLDDSSDSGHLTSLPLLARLSVVLYTSLMRTGTVCVLLKALCMPSRAGRCGWCIGIVGERTI